VQKRSSGVGGSGLSANLPHPQRRLPRSLGAARSLGWGEPHVGTDKRQVHTIVVVLAWSAERSGLTSGKVRFTISAIRTHDWPL
jgi:hypothetical protein